MSRALLGLSRVCCAGTILAAPWLLSGRPLAVQVGLASGLGLAWLCWFFSRLFGRDNPRARWSFATTSLVIAGCGGLVLALAQLLWPLPAGLPPDHAVVRAIPVEINWPEPLAVTGTQVPSLTRLQLARMVWLVVTLVLGAELFAEQQFRRGLWLLLGLNGAALSVFGMIQRLTWNEHLYWFIPQPTPGQPFASFWNRNHAAGYLNLCLAAVVGLLIAGIRRSPGEWWPGTDESRPTARAAMIQLLLIVIPLGVLASISRGGILAAAAASAAVMVLLLVTRSAHAARYFVGSIVVAGVLAGTLGIAQFARSRFEGPAVQSLLEDGRWRHWRDMLPAWKDAWFTGTGLGTYRYANRPYQNHASSATYWNADNEYLELAIEGGMPALVLMVFVGGVLAFFTVRTCQPRWLASEDQSDTGPIALFILVTQGLQAFTDYGISVPANALTLAVMLGGLTGGWGGRAVPRPGTSSFAWAVMPTLGLSLAMVTSVRELRSASGALQFQNSLGELENPALDDWTPFQSDAAIAQAEQLLQQRPDDFLLHRTLAQLHVIRYRHHLMTVMSDPRYLPNPPPIDVAWARTHLTGWEVIFREWLRSGNTTAIEALRGDAAFHHVTTAYDEFQLARQLCAFDARTDVQLALLALPCGRSPAERAMWLASAVQAAPSEPKLLRQIANLAAPVTQDRLAALCWRRAISLDPASQDVVFKEASERLAPVFVLEHVVDQDAAALLRFAEVLDDAHTCDLVTRRLEELLASGTISSRSEARWQLGRLAELKGQAAEAIQHFRDAVRLEPLRWEWRMRLAESLFNTGQLDEALQQVEAALRIAPDQPALMAMRERLWNDRRLRSSGQSDN